LIIKIGGIIYMENQIISDLEKENPNLLFYHNNDYDRINYLNEIDKKVFKLMSRNFLVDMRDEHNMKIKTIKYWFLHNLSILFHKDVNLIYDYENISDEMDMLIDYFRVIYLGQDRKVNNFIYLPSMNMFSNWCNVSNNEKVEIHHKIMRDLIYLDDNYFFLINYMKGHNKKFLVNVVKNKSDMEKGNNLMIHLMRSASFKNCECSLRNFRKLINFLLVEIYENRFMEIMVRKNNRGKKAINLLVFLQDDFYEFMLNKIFTLTTHKEFMDKYFTSLTKYINNVFQLEMILNTVEISLPEKYEHLYNRLIKNKTIQFYEKFKIIVLLIENDLVDVSNDRERLGRKMWDELHNLEKS